MKRLLWIAVLLGCLASAACEIKQSIEISGQTVIEGQTAVFEAKYESAGGPVSYQWLRNGIRIPGATEKGYETGPLQIWDNETRFQVKIKEGRRAYRSAPVDLTVLAQIDVPHPVVHLVHPKATDGDITSANLRPFHCAYFNPAVSQKGKLFVFMPGTAANPQVYQLILKAAAANGYHAVGLAFANDDPVVGLCRGNDSTCPGLIREEILTGEDVSDLVDVGRADSIENALSKLLRHLAQLEPETGWDQFLDADQAVLWENVRVAGHSQGGAMAAYIGKRFNVDRVVMFSSPHDYFEDEIAAWVSDVGRTPTSRYFGFAHQMDTVIPYKIMQKNWTALGMDQFGEDVFVELRSPPYKNSHMLCSMSAPVNPLLPFHNITVLDAAVPLDEAGLPVYSEVWQYIAFLSNSAQSCEDEAPADDAQ